MTSMMICTDPDWLQCSFQASSLAGTYRLDSQNSATRNFPDYYHPPLSQQGFLNPKAAQPDLLQALMSWKTIIFSQFDQEGQEFLG
jgi:hypothetical protein